jgi:hypothetical protein
MATISAVGVKRPGVYSRPVESPHAPCSMPSSTARSTAFISSGVSGRSAIPIAFSRIVPWPRSMAWLRAIFVFSRRAK